MNTKQTSSSILSLASLTLTDPNASKTAKQLAGSALAQSGSDKQTGATMERLASTVLNSSKLNSLTKQLAGTVLSQSNKSRK